MIYWIAVMAVCVKCNTLPKALRLHKCVVCFKLTCEKCVVRKYSLYFCSQECASTFLRGTGEEYEDEEP